MGQKKFRCRHKKTSCKMTYSSVLIVPDAGQQQGSDAKSVRLAPNKTLAITIR